MSKAWKHVKAGSRVGSFGMTRAQSEPVTNDALYQRKPRHASDDTALFARPPSSGAAGNSTLPSAAIPEEYPAGPPVQEFENSAEGGLAGQSVEDISTNSGTVVMARSTTAPVQGARYGISERPPSDPSYPQPPETKPIAPRETPDPGRNYEHPASE